MKVRLLRKLRKKARSRTWLDYSKGRYYAHQKSDYNNYCSWGNEKLETVLGELNDYRRSLILDWINELKEKKINREIRHL